MHEVLAQSVCHNPPPDCQKTSFDTQARGPESQKCNFNTHVRGPESQKWSFDTLARGPESQKCPFETRASWLKHICGTHFGPAPHTRPLPKIKISMFTQIWGSGRKIRITRSYCKRLGEHFLRLHVRLSPKLRPNCGPAPHARKKWHTLCGTHFGPAPHTRPLPEIKISMFTQIWGPDCKIRIARSYGKRLGELLSRLQFRLLPKLRPNCGPAPHARKKWHTLCGTQFGPAPHTRPLPEIKISMFTQTWRPDCKIQIARSYCKRFGELFSRLHA